MKRVIVNIKYRGANEFENSKHLQGENLRNAGKRY